MKKYTILLSIIIGATPLLATPPAHWTIFNYIEANNNITKHALTNIEAMKRIGSNHNINILVQLDQPNQPQTLRYKIDKGNITDDVSSTNPLGLNLKEELLDAARWAYTTYPAQHTMLIFWNHGNGIIDEGKTWADFPSRGILYNFQTGNYLSNLDLKTALHEISTSILPKKLDIIGMDACLMAVLEVAYQIKDTARYLIASQNIEIAPGWHYSQFLNRLAQSSSPQKPELLAQNIVSSFIAFNKFRNTISTLSVIDLEQINELKTSMDRVTHHLLHLIEHHRPQFHPMLHLARQKSVTFDNSRYVDIASFFVTLLKLIRMKQSQPLFVSLATEINSLLDTLSKTVVFAQNGPAYARACGLSIYFPLKEIHPTYHLTDFAQETSWLTFLEKYLSSSSRTETATHGT